MFLTKIKTIGVVLLAHLFSPVFAQDETLVSIFEVIFNSRQVHDKIFFDYKGVGKTRITLPQGTYAFIALGTGDKSHIYLTSYDKTIDKLFGQSLAKYGWMLTAPYFEGAGWKVIVRSLDMLDGDMNVEKFVLFDKINISEKKAKIEFHTETMNFVGLPESTCFDFKFKLRFLTGHWTIENSDVTERLPPAKKTKVISGIKSPYDN